VNDLEDSITVTLYSIVLDKRVSEAIQCVRNEAERRERHTTLTMLVLVLGKRGSNFDASRTRYRKYTVCVIFHTRVRLILVVSAT